MSHDSAISYPTTANEPKVHPLIRRSFAFVPSAGMRLAPEVLILELMREVFFDRHYGATATRDLNPDELNDDRGYCYSVEERAVLHVLRGRRRKSKQSAMQAFFAPAYPQLAERAWLGKNRERVIYNFLLSGPIAQFLWHRGGETEDGKNRQAQLVEEVSRALLGHNSCVGTGIFEDREILAVALGPDGFDSRREKAIRTLLDKTGKSDAVMKIDNDELATRISKDLIEICKVEEALPRMQWLQLLMTFLRFSLPVWMLAQMRVTQRLHEWLLTAMDDSSVADGSVIKRGLEERNRGMLHPTLTPTRELFEHVARYMKCRVELNILLYCLNEVRKSEIDGRELSITGGGRDVMGIDQLLVVAKNAASDIRAMSWFKRIAGESDIRTFLTRQGEHFPAWRNPLMKGQGKNIDEFFRVLYRAEVGDEAGGYLLIPEGRGIKRGFRVFPGQQLLKTVTYLAAKAKKSGAQHGGAGRLVLQDVEEHFGHYGIDFSTAADARPLLMNELRAMGLLSGSPDAGSSVAVACPY